jgi:hypothetical protein
MKTAEEKANEICVKLDLPPNGGGFAYEHIRLALKEQDRDTRHQAAEELLKLERFRYPGSDTSMIDLDMAQSAVINTKAV